MQNKIAIVGEAWGEEEARQQTPFVGPSGYLLTNMLREAGINRADCFITNVFNFRPPNNNIEALCCSKKEDTTGLPPIVPGKYLRAEFVPELRRLYEELEMVKPNLVLALGNIACWALLGGNTGISKLRGTVTKTQFFKV